MNPIALLLFLACAGAILTVPRRWAPVPLLIGCCYMTKGQGIELGVASLPIFRMLLFVGLLRVLTRGERVEGGWSLIDKLMVAWAGWALFASFFHEWKPGSGPIFTIGAVFDQVQVYALVRIWVRDLDELADILAVLALLLAPVAAAMVVEKVTGKNLFAVFGGVPIEALVREGKIRAQACFRHPILAGTVGATVFPLMLVILRSHPLHAIIGMAACVAMVLASASSGPVMSLLFALGGLALWRWRSLVKPMLWAAAGIYVLLSFVMSRPPYYLMSRIDISGGSTGYHRAMLIDQTFRHFGEWWLFGTDRTRHWMPNQGAISPEHTDITNYYIGFGVFGGLLSMLLIIAMFVIAFRYVGWTVDAVMEWLPEAGFPIWCCGCGLLAHAMTSVSVSYFDQSMVFVWLNVAVIASLYVAVRQANAEAVEESEDAPEWKPVTA